MARFIFTYRHREDYVPAAGQDVTAEWNGFFERIGSNVVEPGQPIFERTSLGDVGAATRLAGFSVVEAESLDAATALAQACPTLRRGGGVEIGVLAELPPDHPAMRLRGAMAQSA